MTKDKAYEAAKKLGERAGHDETVLTRDGSSVRSPWRSDDMNSGSPGNKIGIEVMVRDTLPCVGLILKDLDVGTAERIIDLVKERDAAIRLGAEVAEKAAAAERPIATTVAKVVAAAAGFDPEVP